MAINLGSGGPVLLKTKVSGYFSWSVGAQIYNGHVMDGLVEKKHIKKNTAVLEIADDASELNGRKIVVYVALYNATGEVQETTIISCMSVDGTDKEPLIIDVKDDPVPIKKKFYGTEALVSP